MNYEGGDEDSDSKLDMSVPDQFDETSRNTQIRNQIKFTPSSFPTFSGAIL